MNRKIFNAAQLEQTNNNNKKTHKKKSTHKWVKPIKQQQKQRKTLTNLFCSIMSFIYSPLLFLQIKSAPKESKNLNRVSGPAKKMIKY